MYWSLIKFVMLKRFKMGEKSAKLTNMSTMVVETHTTYNSEVKLR